MLSTAPTCKPLLVRLLGIISPRCDSAWLWAWQGTKPSQWAGNTSGKGTHRLLVTMEGLSTPYVYRKPLNCHCLLLHKKEVLHFYINPNIKWSRIQPVGLEQLRQWMKHTPTSAKLSCSFYRQRNRGKLRPWIKVTRQWQALQKLFSCPLMRYEHYSCLTTKQVELRESFPFSLSLCDFGS